MKLRSRNLFDSIEHFFEQCAEIRANARLMREANSVLNVVPEPEKRAVFHDCQRRFRGAWQAYLQKKNPAAQQAALDSAYEILVELNQLIHSPRKNLPGVPQKRS